MKEIVVLNKQEVRKQGLPFDQTEFQDPLELEASKSLEKDYLEELKERAFKKEILRLFIDYYCIRHRTPLKEIMKDIEKTLLVRILTRFNGNQKEAAKFLETRSTTLNEKVKRYNIRFKKKPQ